MDPKSGAEVGVLNCDFSINLLKMLPSCKIYLIDPWAYSADRTIQQAANYSDDVQEARYNLVCALTKPYNAEIIRKTSKDALTDVPDNSLDFVYIDADHEYPSVKFDIQQWHKKVKKGGIVSGHDFCMYHPGVLQAVLEQISDIKPRETLFFDTDHSWAYRKE
jgi:hypothetical protein